MLKKALLILRPTGLPRDSTVAIVPALAIDGRYAQSKAE